MSTRALMTVADFERLPDDGNRHELDEGITHRHGAADVLRARIQARVAKLPGNFVDDRGLGEAATECGFRLSDETAPGPDVVLGPHDTIDAPELLPGFSESVRSLFE